MFIYHQNRTNPIVSGVAAMVADWNDRDHQRTQRLRCFRCKSALRRFDVDGQPPAVNLL